MDRKRPEGETLHDYVPTGQPLGVELPQLAAERPPEDEARQDGPDRAQGDVRAKAGPDPVRRSERGGEIDAARLDSKTDIADAAMPPGGTYS